jgi:hypothetical protein
LDATCSSVLLLDSKTSVPPAGAAPSNVTVHVVEVPEFKLFGLQANWETEMICPKAKPEDMKILIPTITTLLPISTIFAHITNPNELRCYCGANLSP